MSEFETFAAELREDVGKGASRRLRREGRVPAVVYGGDRDPVSVTVTHNKLLRAIQDDSFYSSVLTLKVADGRTQEVVIRDLQRHPFKKQVMHVDFQRITEGQTLRLSVPIHFTNEARSPAGREAGVVISHQVNEVEIEALPTNLPEALIIDLINLEPGDSVMLSDIALPEGVTIPTLSVSEDNDVSVVTAVHIREDQGEGALAAEADALLAEAVEPELVEEGEALEGEEGEEAAEGEGEEGADAEKSEKDTDAGKE